LTADNNQSRLGQVNRLDSQNTVYDKLAYAPRSQRMRVFLVMEFHVSAGIVVELICNMRIGDRKYKVIPITFLI
jgi:hypothetical protein